MADANKSDDKNNVKIFNSVSKLVDTLREKLESKTINVEDLFMMKDLKEIDELKILCSSEDPVLSLTACQGLVSLVQSNSVPLKCAFIILQSICVRKVSGISSAVLNLLVLDLIAQLQGGHKFKNPLPSWKMHPLCKLLIQNPNSWRDIFNRMASICYHHNKLVSDHAIELLKPLFKFFLMESANIFSETCRHQIWKLLIEKGVDSEKEFIFQILSSKYFDCESRDPLEIFSDVSVLCQTTKADKNLENALIPLVTSLVHDALQFCYDPSSILSYLKVLLNSPDSLAHTVVLIMLSQSVTICPAVFLHQLLDFCEWLVNKGHCSTESIWMLVVATLSWLNCVSPILAPAHHSIHNILTVAQTTVSSSNTTHSLIENPYLSCIVSRNWKISSAIQLARLCESLRAEEDGYIKWLSNIPTCTISEVYLLIGALMIGRYEINIRLKTIDIIQKAPPFFASSNLTLILYQLGREKEPEGQLALLRALTSTAVDKSNISSIIFTLKTLQRSNEPNLQILAVDLFTKLWDIEERCFTLLLAALTDDKVEFTDAKFSRQMDIACAAGFRHICEKKPEKHGKELVKPIQNLLIKCQGTKGAVASSFLIQALASLVKARVLSASSTWKQLYPLTEDMQSAVCGSFCELIEACLECNCDEVLNSMCGWLWKLISTCKATFVINSALRAMKKFSVDCMKLRLVPSIYRRNVLLPAKYAKNSATADRRPEDVLDFIPGSVWADFLQNVRNECNDAACELLAYWLQVELMRYRSGVYNIQFGEPQNYEKLPLYSICRGLVDHLRRTSNSLTPESDVKVCKMIFKVLCINRPKPLPPINWNFLLPYIEHPEVKTQALSLAAKEAKGSLSARACIETYINDEFYNEERDLFLYSILTDLARGVPPKTLQNLVGRTLREAFLKKDMAILDHPY
ncbi:focadhesin isoform X2 [Lycorma delicatula]|uniref:focadhesin isoform X2 n=1 Tax=Lycorma delicatula TaxID=130591 RepID=UPI003F519908